jgi:DNA-binding response OmpR family regulator
LEPDVRGRFLEMVNTQSAGHFKSYWKKLDAQEQYILAALPLVWEDLGCQETIDRLRYQCLITQRDGSYKYFSPLFEDFVRRQEVRGLLQVGSLVVDRRRGEVLLHGKPLTLSPTCYALLTCLMQQAGQVLTSEELWKAAWSDQPYESDQQVKSSIRSLRKALGDEADCIVNRRGVGYMFQPTRK